MKLLLSSLLCFILIFSGKFEKNDSDNILKSGPLVGYSTMREVAVWVQTTTSAEVSIRYHQKGSEEVSSSEKVQTEKISAFAAKIIIENLEPGNEYLYEVVINDNVIERPYPLRFKTQELWQWRKDPPPVKFAFGSCLYVNEEKYDRPGKPYGGNYEILDVLTKQEPEFMVWMGDDVYLREADWNSRSGIIKRYTHTRSLPELQPLLGSVHNYATWDDHDYGPNNSDRSFWNKHATREVFELFWPNPSFGINGNRGITTKFQWADIDFFLMDDRTFRSPEFRTETTDREILGNDQVDWLIDNLTSSLATFKFVVIGTQFLNPNAEGENHSMFPVERNKILDLIAKEKIEGVIFLTGDVHRSEITKLERENSYPLHDFTISPLTAGVSREYPNYARVDGTLVLDRNFGLIEITGPEKDRTLRCKSINWKGEVKWDYTINENELK